ncbi:MAG: choice-of-anchor Q domain-containing protein [Candidatus Electrothrix aestuarii]|uniref:Choice-of-anchor Q domain-containing protein n=1 Tax=Candidatus Electrothrix aestuarii TaxID=3062594 RepID=A0AAU8LZW8_9BACT|nr:choice-of-anchor Q domain-containing protein [Candidatus Electrothrix aestuarii]
MKARLRYSLLLVALLAFSVVQAQAAEITVDGTTCTLADAIITAINNRDEGGCVGSGTYVYGHNNVVLETDVLLTAPLPEITTIITIEGQGHTINGNNDANVGSVLNIISTGDLTLNEAIVTHGYTALGGGIYNDGNVALTNSMVSDNTATSHGGGIYGYGNITLTNSTISGNTATLSSGGIGSTFGSVTLISSTVSGNTAGEAGGISSQEGSVTLLNSTVSNNTAENIGGIKNVDGSLTLVNSTVSSNTATAHVVGGVYNLQYESDAIVTLTHSTISNNTAEENIGGIYNYDGTVTLTSSLISGNIALGLVNELANDNMGSINANSYNVFGHNAETNTDAFLNFTPSGNDVNATSDGTNTPLASILDTTLTNNGGPTQTHALPSGSPAIDLDTTCSAGLSEDQRGEVRPSGAGCDAGAFEFESTLPHDNNTGFLPAVYLLLL